MTRMESQKQQAYETAVKALKQLQHLTGNNVLVTTALQSVEEVKVLV